MKIARTASVFLAALIVLMAPLLAVAADVRDGSIPANGLPMSGGLGATWNGSTHKVLRSDADGILRVTEEYPWQLQNDAFPAADTTNMVIATVLRPLGLGWSVSPFGSRSVSVTRVNAGAPRTVKLYLFGSDDNVNYFPIISQNAWSYANNDTAKFDTLMVTIPPTWQLSSTVKQFKLALPEIEYPGRYLQIWAASFDSVSVGSYCKMSLTYEGRWK